MSVNRYRSILINRTDAVWLKAARPEAGIYTTTANQETLDESPMAYKRMEGIIDAIREAVDIVEIIKPVCSFKAAEK